MTKGTLSPKERLPVPVEVFTYGSEPVTVDAAQFLERFGKRVRIRKSMDPVLEEIVRRGEFVRPPDAAELAVLDELAERYRALVNA